MKTFLIVINRSFGIIQSIVIFLFMGGLIRTLYWELDFYKNDANQFQMTWILYSIPLTILGAFLVSSIIGVVKKRYLFIYIPTALIIILRIVKFWYPNDHPL